MHNQGTNIANPIFPQGKDTNLNNILEDGGNFTDRVFIQLPRDTYLEDICETPPSSKELAEKALLFFKVMHPLERYAHGIQPSPGTKLQK